MNGIIKFVILLYLLHYEVTGNVLGNETTPVSSGCSSIDIRCDCSSVSRADWCDICYNLWDCPSDFNCSQPAWDQCKLIQDEPQTYASSIQTCERMNHGSLSQVTSESFDKVAMKASSTGLKSVWLGASATAYEWKWVLRDEIITIHIQGCYKYADQDDSKDYGTQQIEAVNGATMTVEMCADVCQKLGFPFIGVHQKWTMHQNEVTKELVCTCVKSLMIFYDSVSMFQCYQQCDKQDIAAGYKKCGDIDRMIVYDIKDQNNTYFDIGGDSTNENEEQAKCLVLDTDGIMWTSLVCSEKINKGHICEYSDVLDETECLLKGSNFCWLLNRCLSMHVMNYSWFEADGFCFAKGGHLVVTQNVDFTYALNGKLTNTFKHEIHQWWIGLTCMALVYNDGVTPVHFTTDQYGLDQPRLTATSRCLVMKIDRNETSGHNYHIEAAPCNTQSSFMCTLEEDSCKSDPCLHGGECHDGLKSFSCSCQQGWTGQLCDIQQADGQTTEEVISVHTMSQSDKKMTTPDTPRKNKAKGQSNSEHSVMSILIVMSLVFFLGLLLVMGFLLRKYLRKFYLKSSNSTVNDFQDTEKGDKTQRQNEEIHSAAVTMGAIHTNDVISTDQTIYQEINVYEQCLVEAIQDQGHVASYTRLNIATTDSKAEKTEDSNVSKHPDILKHEICDQSSICNQKRSAENVETITDMLSNMIHVNGMVNNALEKDLDIDTEAGMGSKEGISKISFHKEVTDTAMHNACTKEVQRDLNVRSKETLQQTDNSTLLVPDIIAGNRQYLQVIDSKDA